MALCGRVESAAQRTEVLQGFSRSSSSASSFTSVVEEAEGVDGDDTGLVRRPSGSGLVGVGPGSLGPLEALWLTCWPQGCPNLQEIQTDLSLPWPPMLSTEADP